MTQLPQLSKATAIQRDQLDKLMHDERYWLHEKYDGKAVIVGWDGQTVQFFNSKGQDVTNVSASGWAKQTADIGRWLTQQLKVYFHAIPFQMQGELVISGDQPVIYLWTVLGDQHYNVRYYMLKQRMELIGNAQVQLAPCWVTAQAKASVFRNFYDQGKEGVIFADSLASYAWGRNLTTLKWKFIESADLAVFSIPAQTTIDVNGYEHTGVEVHALQDGGGFVSVGGVHVRQEQLKDLRLWFSAHPGHPAPLEVQYLYFSGSNLVQPIAQRVRFDKPTESMYTLHSHLRVNERFR